MNRILLRAIVGLLALAFGNTNIQDGHGYPGPSIVTFRADPDRIFLGETSTLKWRVTGSTKVLLESDTDSSTRARPLGDVDAEGQLEVTPTETAIYALQADGPAGTAIASSTVHVSDLPRHQVPAATSALSIKE